MRSQSKTLSLLLFLLAASCAAAPEDDAASASSADTSGPTASIELRADGKVDASSPLRTTDLVALLYDTHRITACGLLEQGATNAPAVSFSWRVRGGPIHTTALGSDWWGTAPSTTARAVFGPFGPGDVGALEIWFHATTTGCDQWDSNFGKNFVFTVHDARVGKVTFDGTKGHAPASDLLPSGGFVDVVYPGSRLPQCATTNGEGEHWVARYHRFDFAGAWERHAANTFQGGTYPSIPVPPGAHHLELWFEASDGAGCHAYDSQDARNYVLPLAQ